MSLQLSIEFMKAPKEFCEKDICRIDRTKGRKTFVLDCGVERGGRSGGEHRDIASKGVWEFEFKIVKHAVIFSVCELGFVQTDRALENLFIYSEESV